MKHAPLILTLSAALTLTPAVAQAQGPAAPGPTNLFGPEEVSFDWGRGLRDLSIVGVTGSVAILSFVAQQVDLTPNECVWCSPPGGDAAARRALVWSPARRPLADGLSYGTLGAVAATTIGLAIADGKRRDALAFFEDVIIVAQPVLLTIDVSQAVKIAARRQRPYAHYGGSAGTNADDNLSFFSQHTSTAFSMAAASGMVASLRGSPAAPAIWVTGGLFAFATGYFRIAADKHYLSDVLTGALVGSALGVAMPWLLHRRGAPIPVSVTASAVRGGGGVALTGTW